MRKIPTLAQAEQSLRTIVKNHQYEHIGPTGNIVKKGLIIDGFSASAIINVLDRLDKPENKAKFLAMPVTQAANVAFRLLK